jgi:hypothetical protein
MPRKPEDTKLPENASPTDLNANNNTRAEEFELNRTTDTDSGEVLENSTGSNSVDGEDSSKEGRDGGPPPPGTDNSTAERIKVKTSGAFLFHDPFSNTTVDNSDDGGNKDGVLRSALVQGALDDGRLVEA